MLKKIFIGVFILAACVLTYWISQAYLSEAARVQDFFARFPFGFAAVLFILSYVASSFVIVDLKDLFKIVAALLFGVWWSTLFIWIAELFNNVILFHLARRLGRPWLEKKFDLKSKDVGFVEKMCGVWQIFVLRIIPGVPYRILDVAYGLTAVSFRRYFTISAVASPIRIFWFQFVLAGVGGAVFQADKLFEYFQAHPMTLRLGFLYIVVSILAAFLLSRKVK